MSETSEEHQRNSAENLSLGKIEALEKKINALACKETKAYAVATGMITFITIIAGFAAYLNYSSISDKVTRNIEITDQKIAEVDDVLEKLDNPAQAETAQIMLLGTNGYVGTNGNALATVTLFKHSSFHNTASLQLYFPYRIIVDDHEATVTGMKVIWSKTLLEHVIPDTNNPLRLGHPEGQFMPVENAYISPHFGLDGRLSLRSDDMNCDDASELVKTLTNLDEDSSMQISVSIEGSSEQPEPSNFRVVIVPTTISSGTHYALRQMARNLYT